MNCEWQEGVSQNREISLGYCGVVTPVFTKDSEPLGQRKRSLGQLGIVTLVSPKQGEPSEGLMSVGCATIVFGLERYVDIAIEPERYSQPKESI
ncbi:hypothetical protein TNCV_4141531 [Trichonephila clavipes]|nr:hypothetical protein TNCV_4141531 [Trichonephila clavipes]